MFKFFLAWFPMVVLAILNAVIRETIYKPFVGELPAHQISTITGIIIFGFYMWIVFRKWKISNVKQSFLIGIMWLLMTLCFEFLFGHFIMRNTWGKLLHDYNIIEGRIWAAVLVFITFAPYLFYKRKEINYKKYLG